jgi:integrase/recombinase XerD
MNPLPAWDEWYDHYLQYLLDVERKAPGTVRDIRCSLRRVLRWMVHHEQAKPLWQLSFNDYLIWVEAERLGDTSVASLAKYLSHLRGLLEFSWRSGRCTRNVLDGFQLQDNQQRQVPRWLSLEEAKQLVEACPSQTRAQRRERMMILLLYGCGLRTRELYQLRLQDVDRQRQELFIQHGKGGRQRTVPIPSVVYTELLAYLQERGGQRGLLLARGSGRAASAREVCQVVRDAARRAGLFGGITPKVLRHTYATHLMDRGVDLAIIASLMGHRSPQETGVYLHVLGGEAEAAVQHLDDQGASEPCGPIS